jgi:hypothetical protein
MTKMRNGKKPGMLALVLTCVLGIALVTSCQKANEKAAEKMAEKAIEKASGGKADVDLSKGRVKFSTEEGKGEVEYGASSWPEDLPADVPFFEDGKVGAVMRSDTEQGRSWTVHLKDVEKSSIKGYIDALKKAGWEIKLNMEMGEGATFQTAKDKVFVMGTYSGTEKVLALSVTVEK